MGSHDTDDTTSVSDTVYSQAASTTPPVLSPQASFQSDDILDPLADDRTLQQASFHSADMTKDKSTKLLSQDSFQSDDMQHHNIPSSDMDHCDEYNTEKTPTKLDLDEPLWEEAWEHDNDEDEDEADYDWEAPMGTDAY